MPIFWLVSVSLISATVKVPVVKVSWPLSSPWEFCAAITAPVKVVSLAVMLTVPPVMPLCCATQAFSELPLLALPPNPVTPEAAGDLVGSSFLPSQPLSLPPREALTLNPALVLLPLEVFCRLSTVRPPVVISILSALTFPPLMVRLSLLLTRLPAPIWLLT